MVVSTAEKGESVTLLSYKQLSGLPDINNQDINLMISNMTYYKKYLLWNHNESVVVDNVLLKSAQKKVF